LLREPDTSSQNLSTSHSKETRDVPESFHVTQKVQKDIVLQHILVTWKMFSVAYVSGSIARQVLHDVSCDARKTCLTSEVLLRTSVFIYFKEHSDTEQSLTCPSETVGAAVTVMESMMAEMAYLNSVEQNITAAILNGLGVLVDRSV
jgi:ABC-type ATPase with predicted acetyltransferase domain